MCDAITSASMCEETALKPDLNFRDGPELFTALHNSALQNNADAAAILVAAGASRSARSRTLEMPLHVAAKRGFHRVIKVLVEGEGGENTLNERDVDGKTPLMSAVSSFSNGGETAIDSSEERTTATRTKPSEEHIDDNAEHSILTRRFARSLAAHRNRRGRLRQSLPGLARLRRQGGHR